MQNFFIAIAIILGVYASVLSTLNRINMNNGGKITNDGVISPKGRELVKKKER